jgi:hypothetical protein
MYVSIRSFFQVIFWIWIYTSFTAIMVNRLYLSLRKVGQEDTDESGLPTSPGHSQNAGRSNVWIMLSTEVTSAVRSVVRRFCRDIDLTRTRWAHTVYGWLALLCLHMSSCVLWRGPYQINTCKCEIRLFNASSEKLLRNILWMANIPVAGSIYHSTLDSYSGEICFKLLLVRWLRTLTWSPAMRTIASSILPMD